MTANELADELGNILTFLEIEYADYEDDEILKQASTMLRQQQAEIESLKLRELTDEEMKDLIQQYWGDVHIVDPDGYLHEISFIKAVLKKASEK